MELKIEQGQFNTDLYTKIANSLTIEQLIAIYMDEWNNTLNSITNQIKIEVFNRLSTPRKIKWLKRELEDEVDYQRILRSEDYDLFWVNLFIEYSENRKKQIEKQIKLLNPQPTPEGFITESDILYARNVPISNFIEFKRKQALCLWHQDRHPSLYYYEKQNRVKCFVCGRREDVIGVVQELHGVGFVEAIKILQ